MSSKQLYRVSYTNQDLVYEIYAEQISDEALFGFLKIIQPVFGNQSQVVIDPSEEKLKTEFDGVKAFYIPIHNIIRVDEVERRGQCKIHPMGDSASSNVKSFPLFTKDPNSKG
ncbi:MAG: hypothetical protein CMF48_06680 [Legionellales bacterium]|nr:hypothetical protein [Legionellales bacterium]|tara:strand:- start:1348 stop:1686 length:339 start_codon:yes stop_codon:yes gene_type:complete